MNGVRYHGTMLTLFASLAVAAAVPTTAPSRSFERPLQPLARVGATATIRLLSAATVSFGAGGQSSIPPRATTIRLADGEHDARLFEFQ